MQSLHNESLFKNFPLIINILISLDGSSPSLPGGGKQLTRVMGAPWPQFGAVCSSSPLFWDELWNIVFLLWTRHLNCPLVYVLAVFFFFFHGHQGVPSGTCWHWKVLVVTSDRTGRCCRQCRLCIRHVHKGSRGTCRNWEASQRGTLYKGIKSLQPGSQKLWGRERGLGNSVIPQRKSRKPNL